MTSTTIPNSAATANMQSAAKPSLLSIRNVAKAFGRNSVLRNISLEIAEGEFLTILGQDVELTVKPASKRRKGQRGQMSVTVEGARRFS